MTDERRPHAAAIACDEARDLAPLFVLGALERTDEAAVRAHLETCGEPHPEFEELGSVVPALLELTPDELVEPPAALRDRIMAAAAADLASRGNATAEPAPVAERTVPALVAEPTAPAGELAARTPAGERTIAFPNASERTARAERRRTGATSRLDWVIRIAAVLAIVAVGAWGLNLQGQLDRARSFDQAVAAVVQAGGQPGARTLALNPAPGHQGSGIAAVAADGSVVLAMRELPATTGTQVYTAWVIVGEQPTAVGDFSVDPSGIRSFTTKPFATPAGATIALTLEPNPGNTAPKGPVVSAGVAAAPVGASIPGPLGA